VSMPNERTCREMLIPQRMARPGPSKAIRKPSPAVFTSRPRNRANSLRTITWCCCSSSPHFRSAISAACFVESTISVNGDGGRSSLKAALARSERFELPTLGFEVRCSIQLSYERVRGGRLPDLARQGQQPAAGSTRASGWLWRRRLAKTSFPPSDAPRYVNAGFRQVTKEFPHQQDVGFLQLVIVAEFELIGLRHDQSMVGLAENALFLQSIGPSPDGFDGQMVRIRSEVTASSLLVLTIEISISANGLGSNAHALQRLFAGTRLAGVVCSQYGYGDTPTASIAACERYYFLQYIIELHAQFGAQRRPPNRSRFRFNGLIGLRLSDRRSNSNFGT
jgi:hypothetical protein